MKLLLCLLACLIFSCADNQLPPPVPPSIPQHVHWLSPEEGSKFMGKKHIMIYVRGNFCSYCEMEDKVFDDPDIAAELNAHYVAIKTEGPIPGVDFVPTMIWIMPDGNELFRVSHFIKKDVLLKGLQEIAKHRSRDE